MRRWIYSIIAAFVLLIISLNVYDYYCTHQYLRNRVLLGKAGSVLYSVAIDLTDNLKTGNINKNILMSNDEANSIFKRIALRDDYINAIEINNFDLTTAKGTEVFIKINGDYFKHCQGLTVIVFADGHYKCLK